MRTLFTIETRDRFSNPVGAASDEDLFFASHATLAVDSELRMT